MSLPQNCKEEISKSAVSGFHRLYKLDYSRVTQVPNKHREVCIKIASLDFSQNQLQQAVLKNTALNSRPCLYFKVALSGFTTFLHKEGTKHKHYWGPDIRSALKAHQPEYTLTQSQERCSALATKVSSQP